MWVREKKPPDTLLLGEKKQPKKGNLKGKKEGKCLRAGVTKRSQSSILGGIDQRERGDLSRGKKGKTNVAGLRTKKAIGKKRKIEVRIRGGRHSRGGKRKEDGGLLL